MVTTEVGFSRHTWNYSRIFKEGLSELARLMPMELVRLYVTEGTRSPRIHLSYYNRIDELIKLRTRALMGEMDAIEIQAEAWLDEHPDTATAIAAKCGRTYATPRMLLGADVLTGKYNASGFAPDAYLIAPSLRVYELFSWYDESEQCILIG